MSVHSVTYIRYYFPSGLRWVLSVFLLPLAIYLMIIYWFIGALFCLITAVSLWTFKYVTTIDRKKKLISDRFYRLSIPSGQTYPYAKLEKLLVTREKKSYKAASRSRDYWVNYIEYTLHLLYDQNKQLPLFTINDHDTFKEQVERFAKELNLSIESI